MQLIHIDKTMYKGDYDVCSTNKNPARYGHGSDIDDAFCLAYLLAQPKCELLGITTVTGQADKRAMLASILCKAAGKDIPILPGSEEPILVLQKQNLALSR